MSFTTVGDTPERIPSLSGELLSVLQNRDHSLPCCPVSSPESLWSHVVSIGAAASAWAQGIPTVAGVCSTTREYPQKRPPASHVLP